MPGTSKVGVSNLRFGLDLYKESRVERSLCKSAPILRCLIVRPHPLSSVLTHSTFLSCGAGHSLIVPGDKSFSSFFVRPFFYSL